MLLCLFQSRIVLRVLPELATSGALNGLIHGFERDRLAVGAVEHAVERR